MPHASGIGDSTAGGTARHVVAAATEPAEWSSPEYSDTAARRGARFRFLHSRQPPALFRGAGVGGCEHLRGRQPRCPDRWTRPARCPLCTKGQASLAA